MRVLGFMSGTSLDAIDMAVIETDGETVTTLGPAGEAPLPEALRELVLSAIGAGRRWERGAPEPNSFAAVDAQVADAHFEAADAFLRTHRLAWSDIDLIGFHGQTVLHEQPEPGRPGRTRQLGDGARLAARTGVPVAFDFRSADVAAGGHGAPLAPVYHLALARRAGLEPPTAVLNLGGVANLTLIAPGGGLTALDTGPANGLLDLWAERHGRGRYDAGGALALAGRIDAAALERLMAHPYFARPGPKSLDRYDFDLAAVEHLSPEDGAATLAAFTAEAVTLALRQSPAPGGRGWGAGLIVCGGGRRNPALLRELGLRTCLPVLTAEAVGWRGDSVEAELFAYLAARTVRGLPISFPGTTGAPAPSPGGRVVRPDGGPDAATRPALPRAGPQIRPERAEEAAAVAALTTAAFADAPHTSGTEAGIVDGLRRAGALTLSLVAVEDGEVLGHVAFSPVRIDGRDAGWFGLGPVSVRPGRRRAGIGRDLIARGLSDLRVRGALGCVVLGDPAYYGRFGFEADPRLHYPGVPAWAFQRLAFGGQVPTGEVAYHAAFSG